MLISTTIPSSQTIPQGAVVQAIFANAINPYSGQSQRVRVGEIRFCGIAPLQIAIVDVCALGPNCIGYSVAPESLKNISFFVTWGLS